MQYVFGLSPNLRSNIDYIFILRESSLANRKKLYEQFAGVFPNFQAFNDAMDVCTADFGCIVIDNTKQSNDIQDVVFWYKAKSRDNFQMGSDRYWKYHDKHFNQNFSTDPKSNNTNSKNYSVKLKKNN